MTIPIPKSFLSVSYNGAHYPGSPNTKGLEGGANCQQFAYGLLRHFGLSIPDFRSRELWQDTTHTQKTGNGQAVHLSKDNGYPVIEPLAGFQDNPAYRVFIGAKHSLSPCA